MDHRLSSPAVARNKAFILEILKEHLPGRGRVLEIASGSGEHVVYFAKNLPHLHFLPSDLSPQAILSIQGWMAHEPTENILPPCKLDVCADSLPNELSAVLAINLIHISPFETTCHLFEKTGQALGENGVLVLYGPFKKNRQHTAPSNQEFDLWLKEKDPSYGVRDMENIIELAQSNRMKLKAEIPMPANNFCLVFEKGDFINS